MIPIKDINPARAVFPVVTTALIIANCAVYLFEMSMGPHLESFVYHYGVVPKKVSFFLRTGKFSFMEIIVPYFTSMFLHGGWLHLIGNMWYLWIFGDNVEDRLGHGRFLLFYMLCGLAGGFAHTLVSLQSTIPSIGASGAIAGVLGAYVLFFPGARILTLIPLFFFVDVVQLPAIVIIGFWFFLQLLIGSSALNLGAASHSGVAWWAHIGGFLFGISTVVFFVKRRKNV